MLHSSTAPGHSAPLALGVPPALIPGTEWVGYRNAALWVTLHPVISFLCTLARGTRPCLLLPLDNQLHLLTPG